MPYQGILTAEKISPIRLSYTILTSAFADGPIHGPLPEGWTRRTHPQGRACGYFRETSRGIITTADIRDPQIRQSIDRGFQFIATAISGRLGVFSPRSFEIYFEFMHDEATGETILGYYLADRVNHTLFWAEETSWEQIGMVCNDSPEIALTGHYWKHVCRFPSDGPVSADVLENLQCRLVYGAVGGIPNGCPSPYTPEQCEKFLKELEKSGNGSFDCAEAQNVFVAKLYLKIYELMFWNLVRPRDPLPLNRLSATVPTYVTVLSCASLGIPLEYYAEIRCGAYPEKAQTCFSSAAEDGLGSLALALACTPVNILLAFVLKGDALPPTCEFMKHSFIIAQALLVLSSAAGYFLDAQRRGRYTERAIARIMDHFSGKWASDLQLLYFAFIFALPEVLFLWACIWFAIGSLVFVAPFIFALTGDVLRALALVILHGQVTRYAQMGWGPQIVVLPPRA